ncbi:MAG: wyosine base formation [Frankiales bacterium]|nr:wyosine base formation [Frankiales bacterium]
MRPAEKASVRVFDDLEAEQDRIESVLASLDDAAWTSPSAADGWSVADVVLHLAQTEEVVVASAAGASGLTEAPADTAAAATSMDEAMAQWVAAERTSPAETFERWQRARRDAVAALRAADPDVRLPWAAAPLTPTTLATTRLAEHWAHALDIVGPLGIDFPDTERLRHIAWLAHRSLPYGFAVAAQEPHDVYCELTAPDGTNVWSYGDVATTSRITGSAGAFCRVGAQRLAPDASGLVTSGPYADAALRVLRNYAA